MNQRRTVTMTVIGTNAVTYDTDPPHGPRRVEITAEHRPTRTVLALVYPLADAPTIGDHLVVAIAPKES